MAFTQDRQSILDIVVSMVTKPEEFAKPGRVLEVLAELHGVPERARRGDPNCTATWNYLSNQRTNPDRGIAQRATYLFNNMVANGQQRK